MPSPANFVVGPKPKLAALLFWLALTAQGVMAYFAAKPWMTGDSEFYLELAGSIDHGFYGWALDGGYQPDALRPPGYPIILWLLLHKLSIPVPQLIGLQIGAYMASVFLIDRFLIKHRISTVPFRVLAVIYPFGAMYSAFLMAEAWVTFALTLLALLLMRKELNASRLAFAGAIAGVAALIRSDLLLLPFVVGVVVVWREWGSNRGAATFGRAVIPALVAAAVLSPYALWNARHFGKLSPVPVAAAVGNSLYLSTWQGQLPLQDMNALYDGVFTRRVEASGLGAEIRRLNSSFGAPPQIAPFNPASYPTPELQIRSSEVFGQAAYDRIREDAGHYARHVLRNMWALWNTSAYPHSVPSIGRLGLAMISAFVFLAGLIGLIISLQRGWPVRAYGGLIMLYPMVVHLPLHTEARYTAAARPLLLMFASCAVLWVLNLYRDRRGRQIAQQRHAAGGSQ
jgi:hypothetical protein